MKYLGVPQSGSQAATTAGRNRFGQYYRNRRSPVNPNTPAQTVARAILADCSSAWASLDGAEREAWMSWADLHPRTDSLGSTIVLTGAQAFNAVNCLLVALGLGAVLVPPVDPAPGAPILDSFAPTETAMSLGFTPSPVTALHRLAVYVTPPMSGGAMFSRDFRLLMPKAAGSASPALMPGSYAARFGQPAVGQRIMCRARLVAHDGGVSVWSNVVSAVVEADA